MFDNITDENTEDIFLTKEDILSYLTEEEIFEKLVFGFYPIEHQFIVSPFREDTNPGCFFETAPNGKLYFKDFADIKKHRDCFDAVKDMYKIDNFHNTLKYIYDTLIRNKSLKPRAEKRYLGKSDRLRTDIFFKSRAFNLSDKQFWSQYGISSQNLIDDKVFAVESYTVGTNPVTIPKSICYCYTDFNNNRKKLYRPHEQKKFRFLTNCGKNDIGNIGNISYMTNTLYITKSYKDCRVLRNTGLNCIWFQNEGMIPDDDILVPIVTRFSKVIVFFDNDDTGLRTSQIVSNHIQQRIEGVVIPLTLPVELFHRNIKDPSDLRAALGQYSLVKFLKLKGLW